MRLPAPALETLVLDRLQKLVPGSMDWTAARRHLKRVEIGDGEITITAANTPRIATKNLDPEDVAVALGDGVVQIVVPTALRPWAGGTEVMRPTRDFTVAEGPRIDRSLVRGLGRAHALVAQLKTAPELTIEELAQSQGKDEAYVRRLTRLAFLAPDIQRAILDGRQPRGLTLERLMRADPPLAWAEQRTALGF